MEVASEISASLVEKEAAPPALVVIALDSADADSETLLILHQIKSTWPGTRTAVLVEDERQYQLVQTAGVDVIFFEGIIAAQLLTQIEELLSEEADP